MFSPEPRSNVQNASILKSSGTPNMPDSRRNSSLYASKNRTFFTPQTAGRNKTQNASELQLTLNDGQLSDYKLSVFVGFIPIEVSEILLNHEGLPPKASISSNGMAWIISKDRLLLWNISNKNIPCYELHLPNIRSSADDDLMLVAMSETDNSEISCIAITSEGSAIYWSCIKYPRSFVGMNVSSGRGPCDLCIDVIAIEDGFLVGWLSGTLTYIQTCQGQLNQTTLRAQQGRLMNIGRRFSSMIFGSGERSSSTTQFGSLRRLLMGDKVEASNHELFVLMETQLQKWIVSSPPLGAKMVYEVNLDILIKNALDQFLGIQCDSIILQDIQLTGNGLSVLFAATSASVAKYAVATTEVDPFCSVVKILMSDVECSLLNDGETKSYKLICPDRMSATSFYFYDSESIACLKDVEDEEATCEAVDYPNVGGGCYQGLPIFVSPQSVLVKIQESVVAVNRSVADSLLRNKTFSNMDASILGSTSINRLIELSQSEDPLTRFKAIFISSMRSPSNAQHNKTMLSDLFVSDGDVDQLDSLVVGLSREMINDRPSNDPRWTSSRESEMSVVSNSLILSQQLSDKMKAQEAFLVFLKNNGIWDQLGRFADKEGYTETCQILCEHYERLVAAMTLKDVHSDWPDIIDSAIEKCVSKRRSMASKGSLKSQDIFYQEISRLHEIFEQLIAVERVYLDSVNIETNPESMKFVGGVTAIMKNVLERCLMFRRSSCNVYSNMNEKQKGSSNSRLLPTWTSTDAVLRPLREQHAILSSEIIPVVSDSARLNSIFQDLLDITDLILDGLTTILNSVGNSSSERCRKEDLVEKYERTRSDLLSPFVRYQQNERVMSLAEKYCDYELLVQICDSTQDDSRLEEYMTRFDNRGFPEVVFNWYCKTGNRGKLFNPRMIRHPKLEGFMGRPENRFMSWIYDVQMENFAAAHVTLMDLAMVEKERVTRKRTLLSSAKLYALLSKSPPFDVNERIKIIDNNLELISHQELLFKNESILQYLAVDNFSSARVYSPLELIDLLTGSCNVRADEYEFKKAFDLLRFCNTNDDDHPIRDILIDIWVKAILRDDWEFQLSTTDPISSCRKTIFFKFLELTLSEVSDADAVLPSINELLESENLEQFRDDVEFKCKMMVMYEYGRGCCDAL